MSEDDIDWQRLWLDLRKQAWSSLAIVPTGTTIDTRRLADAIASVGRRHLGSVVHVQDQRQLTLEDLKQAIGAMLAYKERNECVIVALDPLRESPASAELARSADAVLLALELGQSAIAEASAARDEIGSARFVGAILLREPRKKIAKKR